MKFYQACFTSVDADGADGGWRVVNESEDARRSAIETFNKKEKTNDTSLKDSLKGKSYCVSKTYCEDDSIFAVRVQYGENTDARGRRMFFSHGYICEGAYELLKDPCSVLGISDRNYHYTLEETKNIPDSLIIDTPKTEAGIMEKYGLRGDSFLSFAKCVFYPFFVDKKISVYIKTDGSLEMANDILYLIYRMLPYSMRPYVSAVTYPFSKSTDTMFVFTNDIPDGYHYIDPVTGDNNILSNKAYSDKLEKNAFIYSYAEQMPCNDEEQNRFFHMIELVLSDFGDAKLNKLQAVRLAYLGRVSTETQISSIPSIILDYMALPIKFNDNIVDYVSGYIRAAIRSKIMLTEEALDRIEKKVDESGSKAFEGVFDEYIAFAMIQKGEAAFEEIDSARRESGAARGIINIIAETDGGIEFLYKYYTVAAEKLTQSRSTTYADMAKFIDEAKIIGDTAHIKVMFIHKCREIFLDGVSKGKRFYTYGSHSGLFEEYQKYVEIIDPTVVLDGSHYREMYLMYDRLFKTAYDESRLDEYSQFYEKSYAHIKDFEAQIVFLRMMKKISKDKEYSAAVSFIKNLFEGSMKDLPVDDKKFYISNLFDVCMANDAADRCKDMKFWCCFAEAKNISVIELLVDRRATLLYNFDDLRDSLNNEEYWYSVDALGVAVDYIENYVDLKSGKGLVLKDSLKMLKERMSHLIKQKKADEKEKKKAEKQAEKAEKKSGNKPENTGDGSEDTDTVVRTRSIPRKPETDDDSDGGHDDRSEHSDHDDHSGHNPGGAHAREKSSGGIIGIFGKLFGNKKSSDDGDGN